MFYRLLNSDKMTRPAGMTFVALAMFLFALGLAFPHSAILRSMFSSDTSDFVQGFCIGIALALGIGGIGAIHSARRNAVAESHPE